MLHISKSLLRRPLFTRTPQKRRSQPDLGLHQPHERGTDAFDPKMLRTRDIYKQLRSSTAIQREQSRDARAAMSHAANIDGVRAQQLSMYDEPRNKGEDAFARNEFERDMQLRYQKSTLEERKSGKHKKNNMMPPGLNQVEGSETLVRRRRTFNENESPAFTKRMYNARQAHETRRLELGMTLVQTPTSKQARTARNFLARDEANEAEVAMLQDRLVEEHGLYPTQRLDAFMLRDETIFPQWVSDLPSHIVDRVRYGGIGLTEEDEVLRQNLARMPHTERTAEWERLKAAREYKRGTSERRVSPREVRDMRLGIRRHHALHRKRLRRAILLKQLAMREPEKYEAWPSRDIDFSSRLAQVAQFVEAGVPTMGEWPLDTRKLANAKRKAAVEADAQKAFVKAGVASGAAHPTGSAMLDRVGRGFKEALLKIEDKERPVKHISRRHFANRFTAVRYGSKDEHGRRYHHMSQRLKEKRIRAYSSEEEMRFEKEQLPPVEPNESFRKKSHQQQWEPYTTRFAEEKKNLGMPSHRVGF